MLTPDTSRSRAGRCDGRYRRSWETLKYALVSGIGYWLERHRGDPSFSEKGTSEALIVWYGEDVGARFAAVERSGARTTKVILIVLGSLLAGLIVLSAAGLVR